MLIEKDQLIAIGIVGLLFLTFSFVVWMPTRKANAAYEQRIAQAQAALEPGKAGPDALAKLDQQVQALQVAVDSQTRTVPNKPRLAAVLRDLTESVKLHGVEQQELETLETKHYRDYSAIPSRLEFVSGFEQAAQIVSTIESLPRLVRLDRMELLAERSELKSPRLEASLNLATFYRRDGGGGEVKR